MKAVILAGGLGTRLSEVTDEIPKPMVRIGHRPMLWHIMKIYGSHGCHEFLVALGYRSQVIKEYFINFYQTSNDIVVNLRSGEFETHGDNSEDWKVHLIETGLNTNTGGRVRRLRKHIGDEPFMLTYGDGVADVDMDALLQFHQEQRSRGSIVTVCAVRPPSRFGGLVLDGNMVAEFTEKPQIGEGWINGGFMVCEPGLFDYLHDDADSLESVALERIAEDGRLAAYRHGGFWQCMDTLRDVRMLDRLWREGGAPWKVWD